MVSVTPPFQVMIPAHRAVLPLVFPLCQPRTSVGDTFLPYSVPACPAPLRSSLGAWWCAHLVLPGRKGNTRSCLSAAIGRGNGHDAAISFLERRGVQGGKPCDACHQRRISGAVFRVTMAMAARGALTLSASRWRRRDPDAKITDVKQFFVPRQTKNRVEICAPRSKYYPALYIC